ncbi:AcrR family transcriptional regulator [Nocardioides ginsengisegetis]|uniref:AcrR family transcriptional regulator n=1 Tax=Nocardioides ginsengisegetis TaxID=661491 RepID=A0A7W3J231_9ACTN|nr:TetR family transcriptional regulator [Nocardioides ginsengisegetis]MBA8804861.1 AcrR family transcriptional regulator [Nocardioides ginsengisegetis]
MSRTTDETRAGRTRARLQTAALSTFADRGFHGTSTRDIAAAAGLSPAAVYMHHSSKEELLFVISRAGHEDTLERVRTAAATSDSLSAQLAAVTRAFAGHHAEAPMSARVVNYQLDALSDEHLGEIRTLRRLIGTEIRDIVDRGVASGEFATRHPQVAAHAILSLGIDVGRWYNATGDWTPGDVGDYYSELALRMVEAR